MLVNLEEAARLYNEATALMKKVFLQAGRNETIQGKEIADCVWRLVEHVTLGDRGLVYFVNRSTPQNFLVSQSVNVCILSLFVGLALGYDTSQLNELGIAALLHNIGMVRCLKTAEAQRKLTPQELEEIQRHPGYGVAILKKIEGLSSAILYVCQEHRRRKWEKPPLQSSEDRMREYAQIVGVLDIYVAMTQPRPHRDAKLSHDAVRELIGEAYSIFDTRIMKTLINQIGIYPVGSWVRLNTNEIARVTEQNKNFPLHPVVEVLFDAKQSPLEATKSYDLYRQQIIYIKEPVDYRTLRLAEEMED